MTVVTLLTDYGLEDDFVGVCHGVVARLAPEARVIDVTHGIARHDVRSGALVLRRALPFMPAGIHVAVVDPGVGSPRRAVALRCAEEERVLVGPDNGLLVPAAERFGGVVEAVDIGRSPLRLTPVSATFHGRDIFVPVAAHLATGTPLAQAGAPLEVDELAGLDLPTPQLTPDGVVAHVMASDRFGNVTLDVQHADLSAAGLRLGRPITVNGGPARFGATFADAPPGELLLYEDAYRTLALAVNRGSAADRLGVGPGDEVRLARVA
jgi:S-adenosylmethionine hydrolase